MPGSIYERDGDRIYNTAPVIDPDGKVVARHRKIYPFLPYERDVACGDAHTVFDIPDVGRFGVSICYDMWFPETTRALAWMGAEVILHPSLTNTVDRDVEIAIARASAATNQCYFIDLNCAGQARLRPLVGLRARRRGRCTSPAAGAKSSRSSSTSTS